MDGFLKVLVSKHLKNRTKTGPAPVSGPGPALFGPDPGNFSPVRVRVPLTLRETIRWCTGSSSRAQVYHH